MAETTKKTQKKENLQSEKIAAILVRGPQGIRQDIEDTIYMLRMRRKFACSILPHTAATLGMVKKCKDYITFGTISQETFAKLKTARGKTAIMIDNEPVVFFLHPPRGGFEKKGIKVPFSKGGVLGDRKEKINVLIERML